MLMKFVKIYKNRNNNLVSIRSSVNLKSTSEKKKSDKKYEEKVHET